jgi:hypothetical protein
MKIKIQIAVAIILFSLLFLIICKKIDDNNPSTQNPSAQNPSPTATPGSQPTPPPVTPPNPLNPRVVSVHNSSATNWDHQTGYYWENINQSIVDDMVATGLMALTGKTSEAEAWRALIPYQSDEEVLIKLNFNNSSGCSAGANDNINPSPELMNVIINGLISIGVPANRIWITDPSRAIPCRFINGITTAGIQYFMTSGTCTCNETTQLTTYIGTTSPHRSATTHPVGDMVRPAQVFIDAEHLINIPQLKGHGTGHITLSMKNHYGSVTFSGSNQSSERSRMHTYVEPYVNPDLEKSLLADICNNPHIRDKTRLIIGDGLFGHPTVNWQGVSRWQIFNNDDPNILFFGVNMVATDSVMADYIIEEHSRLGYQTVTHSSLHHGAQLGLGIHEHWDGFATKKYNTIDYIPINQ